MEQYGNVSTFNIESVLYQNVQNSEYYKNNCMKLTAIDQLIDEVFYSMDNVEPWMSGNARGASSAFCLLYRLGQLKPTDEDVQSMLDHSDSPFIRALGFLYLRYVLNPRLVWDWLQYYINDQEEFQPSGPTGKTVSIGAFARDIFLDQYYFETIFPRIPKPVGNDISTKLQALGLPSKAVGNAGQGGGDRRGIEEGNRRPASVKASLSVAMGQRAPNRAAGREEGRGLGSSLRSTLPVGVAASKPRDSRSATMSSSAPRNDRKHDARDNSGKDSRDYRSRERGRDSRLDQYRGSKDPDRGRGRDYRGTSSRDRDRSDCRTGSRRRSSSADRSSRDVFRDRADQRHSSRDIY